MPNPIQNVAAKGAGKVGAAEAVAKGLKGVFVTLAEEHHQVSLLLSQARGTDDADKRSDLWTEIKKQLVSHERAELAEVYPALSSDSRTEDIARVHANEADELESSIDRIDAMEFDSPQWKSEIDKLISLVKNHVSDEEGEFFPRAQEVLGEGGAKRLEKPFLSAKEREMSSIQ